MPTGFTSATFVVGKIPGHAGSDDGGFFHPPPPTPLPSGTRKGEAFESGGVGKLTDEEVGGFGGSAIGLTVGKQEGVVGVDGVGDEGRVVLTALNFADDGGEPGEDNAVSVLLVSVVEAGDIHQSGFVFEVKEHNAFAGGGGRHPEADRVANDEGFGTVRELAGRGGGDSAFGLNAGPFVGKEMLVDIESEDVAFGEETFGGIEIGDVGRHGGFGVGKGEGVVGF